MRKLQGYGPSLIVLITALVVLLAGPSAVRQIAFYQARTHAIQASLRLETTDILTQLQQAYRDIATVAEPSVVHISAEQMMGGSIYSSTGSGWIYDNLGHIVTNYHVIEDAQRIQVQLHTGEMREAELLGRDRGTDIAVIRISPERLLPATRASSDDVRQGDIVFAFGSPFEFRFSMSQGVVSGIGRYAGLDDFDYEDFIQVDAAINPGNSGGPLTDLHGRVIGMNTAIATGQGNIVGHGQFAGIGLTIPMSMIESVVDQIIERGEVSKGYLGVQLATDKIMEATLDTARTRGFQGLGVAIGRVEPDGPAAQSGLQVNDIITHVQNRPVESAAQVRSVISSARPGDTVSIHVWRWDASVAAGAELDMSVTLARLDPSRTTVEYVRGLGLDGLTNLSRAEALRTGLTSPGGVIIEQVVPGMAYDGIIKPRSIIVAVAGRSVANTDEFYNAVQRCFDRGIRGAMITLQTPDGELDEVPLLRRNPFVRP
jgi:serine protease Do